MFASERRKQTGIRGSMGVGGWVGGGWITECSALTSYLLRSYRIGSKMGGNAEETELLTASAPPLTS